MLCVNDFCCIWVITVGPRMEDQDGRVEAKLSRKRGQGIGTATLIPPATCRCSTLKVTAPCIP